MTVYTDNISGCWMAEGLTPEQRVLARHLYKLWRDKLARNELRDRYYYAKVRTKTLGVAVSRKFKGVIDSRVDWPAKAVDYLAARSQINGFVSDDDGLQEELRAIALRNDLTDMYDEAKVSQLTHGCVAFTVTERGGHALVNAYPLTACALKYDDAQRNVEAGLVIAESEHDPWTKSTTSSVVKLFTSDAMVTMTRKGRYWEAEQSLHDMGRPVIEAMPYRPTLKRPFGRSRITETVMKLTNDAQREKERAEIAAEFAAYPQKYLLGTDSKKIPGGSEMEAYIGAILEVTKGRDGSVPNFGQLSQMSMQPHIDYMRDLAAQFAGSTNIPVSALGVVHDNPASAEALAASKEDIVIDCDAMNRKNGRALRNVMLMALAVEHGTDYGTERDSGAVVAVDWKSPLTPSEASMADATLKRVQAVPSLADSDVTLEDLGYSQEKIVRIKADRRRADGTAILKEILGGADGGDTAQGD